MLASLAWCLQTVEFTDLRNERKVTQAGTPCLNQACGPETMSSEPSLRSPTSLGWNRGAPCGPCRRPVPGPALGSWSFSPMCPRGFCSECGEGRTPLSDCLPLPVKWWSPWHFWRPFPSIRGKRSIQEVARISDHPQPGALMWLFS